MNLEDHLIAAIQAGDLELAKSLSGEYGRRIASELRAAATDDSFGEISTAALEQLGRALILARVVRAHLAVRMHSTTRHSAYGSAELAERHWMIEA